MRCSDERWGRAYTTVAGSLIVCTPLLMIASREIPATALMITTLLLVAAASRSISLVGCGQILAGALRSPMGMVVVCLMAAAFLSVAWSPQFERGATHALHFSGGVVLAALAVSAANQLRPRFNTVVLALIVSASAGTLALDILLAGALREALFLSTDVFRLNRATVAITLFLPLATALLAGERRFVLLGVLWASAIAAVLLSISYSAKLAFAVIVLVLPITVAMPRIVHRLTTFALPLTVLAMPWIASVANSLVPARIHEAVGYGSLTIRGEIWQETVPFIWQKPFFGWGIEASHVLPHLPEAAHLTQVQRDLLSWGHTHNAPLQIWLELGAVGAALTAAALYFGLRSLRALPPTLLPYATTTVIAAFAIACVSHGAWQAWWWALLGLIATAYAMAIAAHFPEVLRRAGEPDGNVTA